MKIKSLHLHNFRCYADLQLDFHEDLTVIVGTNGAGKTTILDGVVGALAKVSGALGAKFPKDIPTAKDIRIDPLGGAYGKGVLRVEFYSEGKVGTEFSSKNQGDAENQVVGHGGAFPPQFCEIKQALDQDPNANVYVPIYAYYRSTRNIGRLSPVDPKPSGRVNRIGALESAENAFAQYQQVSNWLYQKDVEEAREIRDRGDLTYRNPDKQRVVEAVTRMLEPVEDVTFTKQTPYRLILKWRTSEGDVEERFVSQLSDGYRNMLALVMDFARRLTQANPQLPNPLDSEALLLIDEIDLHLHPEWQQSVIGDLRRTFPNTQIICTTHSPQVLSTVKPENVLILRGSEVESANGHYTYGVESYRVLQSILGVPSAPLDLDEVEKLKNTVMEALEPEVLDRSQFDKALGALELFVGHDAPFLVNARAERIRLEKKS